MGAEQTHNVHRKYKVLIVEDCPLWSSSIQTCLNQSPDFTVISTTDSASKAFEYVKTCLPDAMIVDLQLNEGDGLELLSRVRDPKENLPTQPYILVTTSVTSPKTLSKLNKGLSDFVFSKHMVGYSPEHILRHLRLMSDEFDCNKKQAAPPPVSQLEREELIRARVVSELDNYYINHMNIGKDFLIDAICMVVALPKGERPLIKQIFVDIGKKHKKDWHSIDMGISRLLQSAFSKTAPEDLVKIYKPYVDIGRGAPSNKEFIVYTAEKIKAENKF